MPAPSPNYPHNYPSAPVFRVDIFNVPQRARRRFLEAVEATHEVLRSIPGLIEEHILERPGGPGASNIVTIAMWRDEATVRHARSVVGAWHNRTGFNPQTLMRELGVEAAIGEFRPVEAEPA